MDSVSISRIIPYNENNDYKYKSERLLEWLRFNAVDWVKGVLASESEINGSPYNSITTVDWYNLKVYVRFYLMREEERPGTIAARYTGVIRDYDYEVEIVCSTNVIQEDVSMLYYSEDIKRLF
jgi:hypothetical protein